MAFDIHEDLIDLNTGEFKEKAAGRYLRRLIELFEESPEGQPLTEEEEYSYWTDLFLEYSIDYQGLTPPEMTRESVSEVLLGIFPAKVTAEPESAPQIVKELMAFWRFLGREFELENAQECEQYIGGLTTKIEQELGDPSNYGMAKSMMMAGLRRGFDLSTDEGVNEWMKTYNQEMISGKIELPPLPMMGPFFDTPDAPPSRADSKAKQKRKKSSASRKRNRPKKRKKK